MIKSELIQKLLARNPHLFYRDVESVTNVIFNTISDGLANGSRVEIRGFGVFGTKKRSPRLAQNPRTGGKVAVTEQVIPYFKTGKELKEKLNQESDRLVEAHKKRRA